ncbi:MAG TPA: adenylate kinase [Bacteroidales bacterium]|nr:MAG: adenylate kinase [Bacteroidetes bacterium GWE2_42_24]OFY27906.1 MAG: adenylate kinase [Bacteroidetes bacterium GWF2_43_11]HBZ68119.1 adenylate kinase [Bacteroidales bacterium]
MLNVALFGAPGAGKGTQSKLLIEKYNLVYVATGDLLRQEIAEGSDLGMEAKDIIEKGGLAPDDIIVQIIEKRISTDPSARGILFDGFPRTVVQAYILEGLLLRMNSTLSCMLALEVPREELIRRMLDRAQVSGRSDDNLDVIKVRLEEYENKTKPVAQFYLEKDKFYPIEGTGDVNDIFQRVTQAIDQSLKKEWMNVVLLGPPGSGKGTQGKTLAEKHNLIYISTGSLLRHEILQDTEVGRKAAPFMERGEIVPDEIAIRLIEREIKMHPNANGFIFKGFPRTIVQAYILDGLLRRLNSSVNLTIELKVPTLECFKRLAARGKLEKSRTYDRDPALIVHRLEEYETKTSLVKTYYKNQGKYQKVDGIGPRDEVSKRLYETVDQMFRTIR